MFHLAHISDIHLSPLPGITYRELMSKRITGYINWLRNRQGTMTGGVLEALTTDIKALAPDHIAVTGDLVNLALNLELETARLWLETLGAPADVSLVPGNHDAYVPGALDKACHLWEPWMRGDGIDNAGNRVEFPYMRVREDVALIGVSSARATAPFLASGDFSRQQAERLGKMLDEAARRGLFRVVMIHHPPVRGAAPAHKRLFGIRRFQKIIAKHGAELIIHGHTHLATRHAIEGPSGKVPVICVPSASQNLGGKRPAARFNLFSIGKREDGTWTCRLTERGIVGPDEEVVTIAEHELV
ncbi:metallophosphoesterase family protein [Phyllobacterium leguminum]|uniref:3',5'-cyclic AMP phosphodiesterase CpdA n=1 Tax=Phyllobacterium leguminum TaxID=314237 RepID=A0A318T8W3_9HYPH|nr:metallophosphoesterase [Phyllobacterium leguminum]PYE87100.1 3',5'-cyclic AMP phosphodiesterase CpdA [Phyllobacterium leguminum]